MEHAAYALRLDGEDDDGSRRLLPLLRLAERRGLAVALDHAYAVLRLHLLAPRRARVATHDLAALDKLSAQQSRDHRLGHHADANEGEPRRAQRVGEMSLGGKSHHAPMIFTRPPRSPSAKLRNRRPCVEIARSGDCGLRIDGS